MHCGKTAGFWGRAKDMFEDCFFECPGAAPRRQDVPIRHKDGGEHADRECRALEEDSELVLDTLITG